MKCSQLGSKGFLLNNDINATGICIGVLVDDGSLINVHAHQTLWEFLFANESERILKACRTGVGMKNMVRLAFKSMKIVVAYSPVDPDGDKFMNTNEIFFMSHKKKIEELNLDS